MPRVIIEYTSKLIEHKAFDPALLITAINKTLMDSQQFGDDDIKTIALSSNLYARSTQPQGCEFVCVTAYILSGRSAEIKRQISNNLLQVLQSEIKPIAQLKTQVTVSIQDVDRESFTKAMIA